MEEMKNVRLSQESIDILKRYGDTPNKGVSNLAMMAEKGNPKKDAITKEEFRIEMDRLRDGIKAVHAEYMKYLSSGQGAIKVPTKSPADHFIFGVDQIDGFKTAAQVAKEERLDK
jgi:hypothetical protein